VGRQNAKGEVGTGAVMRINKSGERNEKMQVWWPGHDQRKWKQVLQYWQVPDFKMEPGRPRANWKSMVSRDLQQDGTRLERRSGTCSVCRQSRLEISCGGPMRLSAWVPPV